MSSIGTENWNKPLIQPISVRMVTLNLRERKPPIRAKASCGPPSMTTPTKHTIGMRTKGRRPDGLPQGIDQ